MIDKWIVQLIVPHNAQDLYLVRFKPHENLGFVYSFLLVLLPF